MLFCTPPQAPVFPWYGINNNTSYPVPRSQHHATRKAQRHAHNSSESNVVQSDERRTTLLVVRTLAAIGAVAIGAIAILLLDLNKRHIFIGLALILGQRRSIGAEGDIGALL